MPLNLVFIGQLLIGYAGMQRRLYDPSVYDFLRPLLPLNRAISHAAFVLGAAQLIFVVNFFWSLRARARAPPPTPGRSARSSGRSPSPPPHHNFDRIPIVRARPARARQPARRARWGGLAGAGRGAAERDAARADAASPTDRHDAAPTRARATSTRRSA